MAPLDQVRKMGDAFDGLNREIFSGSVPAVNAHIWADLDPGARVAFASDTTKVTPKSPMRSAI
ncbi:MAG: hypothetical protein M3O26_21145 [Pseudomonadota bacterium]|nr:hypothetical protein [Pseudomonadota bacterium]